MKPRALSDEALQMIARRFGVLSEVLRLKILIQLESGEKNVGELANALGAAQANVSRHLQALAEAGILARRKDAQRAFYRICDPGVFDLCRHVCGSLKKRFESQAKVAGFFET
jgi:DNA-binding transcriptional ArsR family regulator